MDNSRDRRKLESILREPLTRHRLSLNNKIRAAQNEQNPKPFTIDDFKTFIRGIRSSDVGFQKEIVNVIEAVETGVAPASPRFDTPELQLVWGAALAFLNVNPAHMQGWNPAMPENSPVSATPLWKQVTGTRTAYQELLSHAHHVREALRDKSTKYSWGDPGSGFTFDRNKNFINIDLMQSMIAGFEHARADVYREIGHSLLSKTYPVRMQAIYKEMIPLLKKMRLAQDKKGPQLKPDEYKKLRMLSAEWELRHMMFAAAEENVANRFVANIGQQVLQDYGVSLNNTAVTLRGVGLTRLPSAENASEDLLRYMNLCNTVQLSFFQNNNLFDNTEDGWYKVGIDTARVRKTNTLAARPDNQKEDDDGISHADFLYLRELCGGPKGLENQQPKQHERLYGWENLTGRVARADEERKRIIEEIWSLYSEDLIQNILKQANDQIDEQLKDAKDKQQGQDGQDQDDQDQDGEEQEGQEGQGQGQGQGKGKGKGKPQPQKDKQSQQKKDRGRQQGEQDDSDEDGDQGQKGDKQKDKQKKDKGDKGEKGEKQDGDQGDQDQDADGDGKDGQKKDGAEGKLGTDKDNKVPVEGAGDMPSPDIPTEIPSDELEPGEGKDKLGKDGEGKDGKDADGDDADDADADGDGDDDDGQTVDDLEDQMDKMDQDEAEGDEADGDDADGDGDGPGQKGKKGKPGKGKQPGGKQAGHGKGQPLGDLAKKDWTNYRERISELTGPISRVRKLFKAVQERQLQRKRVTSQRLDILPLNGEVKDRFNAEAHRAMTIKKATGQLEEDDLKRFHADETKMIPTEIDIVIAIDGSGSMNGVPLDSALQAAAIMFEAAAGKDMKMNVYVMMWGDNDPPLLIKPGDNYIKIGQEMERAHKGLNSGTDLAPAVRKVAEVIGDQHGKSGTLSGFTHVLVLSDGDIFDADKAKKALNTMFTFTDKVTFDTAIIKSKRNTGTSMQQMAKSIKGRKSFQDVGVALGDNPEEVPMAIVGLLLEKVRKCGSFTAVPNSQKRRAMKKAHNKMDPKR